ncbi:MAG: DUF2147 domain-containing protein [Brevinema sp.]
MYFTFLLILLSTNLYAVEASDILGFWFISRSPSERVGVAEIFEKDGRYYANAFAYRDKRKSEPRDVKNPNADLRHRLLSEVILIYNLKFDGETWADGRIYNPENGKSYYLKGTISDDKDSLIWRASIDRHGVFGRNIIWKKLPNPEEYKYLQLPKSTLEANIPL